MARPGATIDYLVDGAQRRVGKVVNGTLVQGFLWEDTLRVAAQLDGSGAVVARFVYGTQVNVPEYMVTATGTYRFVTDHLGSVRQVIDVDSGEVVQEMEYDAWGRVLDQTCPSLAVEACQHLHPFGFAGGLYDPDTTLVRLGARDYDATLGRWTARDSLRFGGGDANLYGYALGDPINLRDPFGLYSSGTGSILFDWLAGFFGALHNFEDRQGELADLVRPYYEAGTEAMLSTEDQYFHCLSHCQAVGYGTGGTVASHLLGPAKEILDTVGLEVGPTGLGPRGKGLQSPREFCEDSAANDLGRALGSTGASCEQGCAIYLTSLMR